MAKARYGDKVRVRYEIQTEENTSLPSTIANGSVQLALGEEELFPGSDLVIIGMDLGESKTVRVPVEVLFGPWREGLVRTLHPEQLPVQLEPEVGQTLQMRTEDGQSMPVTVTKASRLSVTLDAYQPLTGKDLIIVVQLDKIIEAKERSV